MGTVIVISTISPPREPSRVADGTPFRSSRSFCPDYVPGGIFSSARPSIVGTSLESQPLHQVQSISISRQIILPL
jgi:hypothetical protein